MSTGEEARLLAAAARSFWSLCLTLCSGLGRVLTKSQAVVAAVVESAAVAERIETKRRSSEVKIVSTLTLWAVVGTQTG